MIVTEALETWRRHRRNGTMPPKRTMNTIVGAARRWASLGSEETREAMRLALHCKRAEFDAPNPRIQAEALYCDECDQQITAVLAVLKES